MTIKWQVPHDNQLCWSAPSRQGVTELLHLESCTRIQRGDKMTSYESTRVGYCAVLTKQRKEINSIVFQIIQHASTGWSLGYDYASPPAHHTEDGKHWCSISSYPALQCNELYHAATKLNVYTFVYPYPKMERISCIVCMGKSNCQCNQLVWSSPKFKVGEFLATAQFNHVNSAEELFLFLYIC